MLRALLLTIAGCCLWTHISFSQENNGTAIANFPQTLGGFVQIRCSNAEMNKMRSTGKISFARETDDNVFIVRYADAQRLSLKVLKSIDPESKFFGTEQKKRSGLVILSSIDLSSTLALLKTLHVPVTRVDARSSAIVVNANQQQLNQVASHESVTFIKPYQEAREEVLNSFQDNSVNEVSFVHANYPGLGGFNFVVSVKERNLDPTDIDLRNRVVPSSLADSESFVHANQMATIIAGAGNSSSQSKGAAWLSNVLSTSYDNLLPDDHAVLNNYRVTVQNHSYGTSIENVYGPEAKAYDAAVYSNPQMLHVFSSGNSGEEISGVGKYSGVPGYANLTGSMKMAKNILVVGGHDREFVTDTRVSSGPTYDGRIKPELVAYGPEGSSDAAAMVSGAAVLVQEAFNIPTGTIPSSDLVISTLIASADDVGSPGIDHRTGYGKLNLKKAVELVKNLQYFTDDIASTSTLKKTINVPSNVKRMKVVLRWIDPPAEAGDLTALNNDLDLSITDQNANEYLPWVLSHYPHVDSLQSISRRDYDHLNNTEVITIDRPERGSCEILVAASTLMTSGQKFAVAYWFDLDSQFKWTYPVKQSAFQSNDETFLRWNSSFEGFGQLEISVNGSPYQVLDNEVMLASQFYKWNPDNVNGTAVARMKVGSSYYMTDTFAVNAPIHLEVGYDCDTEFMLKWNAIPNASAYRLYTLGDKYLEPLLLTSDTIAIFQKLNVTSDYFAVAPVFENVEGLRSESINIKAQGVKCYYTIFNAIASSETEVQLSLQLSTLFHVNEIEWQWTNKNQFETIGSTKVGSQAKNGFLTSRVLPGLNFYRAVIYPKGKTPVATDTALVYFADASTGMVFPNPVHKHEDDLQILTTGDNLVFRLFDVSGRLMITQVLTTRLFKLNMSRFNTGFYLFNITRQDVVIKSGKLVLK